MSHHSAASGADFAAARAEIEANDKNVAHLKARAALAGYSLCIISATGGGSAFLVQRWDRSCELPDVPAVEAFLQRAGAQP